MTDVTNVMNLAIMHMIVLKAAEVAVDTALDHALLVDLQDVVVEAEVEAAESTVVQLHGIELAVEDLRHVQPPEKKHVNGLLLGLHLALRGGRLNHHAEVQNLHAECPIHQEGPGAEHPHKYSFPLKVIKMFQNSGLTVSIIN